MTAGTRPSKGMLVLPLMLIALGVVLLLWNFLLLDTFNPIALLPILLVVIGVRVLVQGDLVLRSDARTFGITRGRVEQATLEISASDVDVILDALSESQADRLIAGQYAPQARPVLDVEGVQAQLFFYRHQTPWASLVDWVMALARDLPWRIYVSTSTGQIRADFEDLIIGESVLASGLGDIQVTCPYEAFEPLRVTSTLGTIHLISPQGYRVVVYIEGGRLSQVHVDEERYIMGDDGSYMSRNASEDAPDVYVVVRSSYGDVYLV